jgi:hypothetical protein
MRRLIIVRCGDSELFERLRSRFADDPGSVIRYDRRTTARRTERRATPLERRRSERRTTDDAAILAARGYFVVRVRPREERAPEARAARGAWAQA